MRNQTHKNNKEGRNMWETFGIKVLKKVMKCPKVRDQGLRVPIRILVEVLVVFPRRF